MTDRARAAMLGVLVVLVVLVVLAPSGCSTAPEPDEPAPEITVSVPPAVPSSPGPTFAVPPPPPPVSWAGDGRRLSVVTYGSSSCPTGPTDFEVVGDQELRLRIDQVFPDRDPCTADMAPFSDDVDVPPGISSDQPVTVHLRYGNGDEETVVLSPAG
ncbi:hypothetical protein FHU33_1728 [Blastococcus colisei]|uniref:Uncharacterized protein n=1 Tax=Blastococcus colisei TaxID=1564162 RepID=A0A543PE23_9ACTN|nr:hypothetical protein [Blastococcus colisei]TQN42331.1 hypothetical protein FHU33_1728 [Blastococcus colisei]